MDLIVKPYEKRFFLALLIVVGLAYMFWTGSRYPALDEKAMMSGAIQLEDSLSFEAWIPITEDMGVIHRICVSTLNWINTNKKGMTFGVLFAAAFLTMIAYLKRRSFDGAFSNSVLGMVIGAPLGVCVNCAAPIARGLYAGGMRAETTLSAMISSPTLNIVVLTLGFSLLPTYMMLSKIALSVLIILVAVPLICRVLPQDVLDPTPEIPAPQGWSTAELAADHPTEGIISAVFAVTKSFGANLWFIIKLTVPLMLLAGFLGALVATLLPQDMILGLSFGIGVLLLIALVGLFLPVPIAFDVVICGALMSAGLEQGFVMALLFTLGSFSIYSFFIVAQAVALRAAVLVSLAVLCAGVFAGAGAQHWHNYQSERALELLLEGRAPAPQPMWAAAASEADPWHVTSIDADRVSITANPFATTQPAPTPFTRFEASTIGIDKPIEFSFRDMWPPFWEGRSVASGDLDNDGDLDVVIASTGAGLYIYLNDGTGQFAQHTLDIGPLAKMDVFNAVIADIDNDGWRDLFVASYLDGNYLLRNSSDGFSPPEQIANRDGAVLSIALSLADVDKNGFLDVALGNWTAGWYRRVPSEESRNRILWNNAGQLGQKFTDLPGIPGETLSILLSDINSDGATDLLVGNDFEIPDVYYYGDGTGALAQITHADGLIPRTTTTTMSIKTADLMNDGTPEIYLAQIAGRSSGVSETLKMQPLEQYCDSIEDATALQTCQRNMAIKTWYKSGNNFDPTYAAKCKTLMGRDQDECKAMLIKDLAIQRNDPKVCRLIPKAQKVARAYCDLHFLPARVIRAEEAEASYPQILRANVLLEGDGPYQDTADTRGLGVGGWSWDTKIADFDHDGFQDVYIVNGTWVPNEVSPSNLFFHNQGNGTFAEASGPFGLEDYLMTASATQFDMDGDGDLDVLTHPVNGPLTVFRNNAAAGKSIVFELVDHAGNRDGIGAVVTITDGAGRTQSREIQMGGGFMSFDAPRVHFGLGDSDKATHATIRWANGLVTKIEGPLLAGALYQITRH